MLFSPLKIVFLYTFCWYIQARVRINMVMQQILRLQTMGRYGFYWRDKAIRSREDNMFVV